MFLFLKKIQQNLTLVIPICMIIGIFYGAVLDAKILKSAIMPLTFLMVYPMMINFQIQKVFAGKDSFLQVAAMMINFAFIPFIALLIGNIFFSNQPLMVLGLLLTALLPTSGMTISWTGFANGNMSAAIKMTVIGLITGSLATPLYVKILMGTTISIPMFKIFQQIAIVVFLPMVAGVVTQKIIISVFGMEKYNNGIKQKFPLISTLGVLGIVFVAMALKANTIISNPFVFAKLFVPVIFLYLINFFISTLIGKIFFNRKDAIALVYGTVMRNLSIALAVAMTAFGKEGADIALIIAIGYIIQVQSAAWYIKFTDKIFGKK